MQKDNTKTAVVHGTMDFFHYLQDRPHERFSRFEAYIYMLDKACANYRPQNIEKKWIPAIGDGQFFTTKTELAADWHWHRATVRDFLAKLQEFGCLVIEDHLKGILCTLPRLVTTFNTSVAVCFNFDAMAKYTMYSWADGRIKLYQVERIIGQMERSAKVMLSGTPISAYAEKQLENIPKMIIHYAIEAIIAHHPGELKSAKEIGCTPLLVEKRALELLGGQFDGNWTAFLSLLYNKTEVALSGLVDSMRLPINERGDIFEQLHNEAASIENRPVDPNSETELPDEYSEVSSAEDSGTVPSNTPSESDSEPLEASFSSQSINPSK